MREVVEEEQSARAADGVVSGSTSTIGGIWEAAPRVDVQIWTCLHCVMDPLSRTCALAGSPCI